MKKSMLESFLVPDTIFVKHKDFFRLAILPNEVAVEQVVLPHEIVGNHFVTDFLQVFDINNGSVCDTKQLGPMEYNLFSVR